MLKPAREAHIPKFWTPKSMAAWITTGLGIVSVIVGIILGVRQLIPKSQPPSYSAVFILDVSHATPDQLATAESDIQAALSSLGGVPTSLRVVNGCENPYTTATVPFGTNNGPRYSEVFRDLSANKQSEPGFPAAQNAAVKDLNSNGSVAAAKQKLVYMVMAETCPGTPFDLPGTGLTLFFTWLGPPTAAVAAARKHFTELGFTVFNAPATKTKFQAVVNRVVSGSGSGTGGTTPTTPTTTVTTPNTPGISTLLSETGGSTDDTVSDSATLTGATADASGTVSYSVYTDSACSNLFADGGTVDVTNGQVPASNGVQFSAAGTYYWQAVYTGDSHNSNATSTCTDESLVISSPPG